MTIMAQNVHLVHNDGYALYIYLVQYVRHGSYAGYGQVVHLA